MRSTGMRRRVIRAFLPVRSADCAVERICCPQFPVYVAAAVDADDSYALPERLLKAMRKIRPGTVREFFALANQHMRWELNDLARRLDEQPPVLELDGEAVPAPSSSDSELTPNARRMLDAIDELPDEEREAFGLLRIHALTYPEAAKVLGVSVKTVQRRVNRSLLLLAKKLDDLRPA